MTDTATLAREAVGRWLLLDAGDPACNDARDFVESLGRDVQHEATRVATALRIPLADVAAHRDDGGEIAEALAELRGVLGSLDPSELDTKPSWVARTIASVPGVGTPASRYFKRLESSRSRVTSIIRSLEAGRGVLSRDNITLRADQERLHEFSTALDREIANVQAFDDALVFAIDVELPFGDLRRPLFEDELLVTVRQRLADLEQAAAANRQVVTAIESVMSSNRDLLRGIDRTSELTLGAFTAATSAAAAAGAAQAENAGPLRTTFDEIDVVLNDIDERRREPFPDMPVSPEETP